MNNSIKVVLTILPCIFLIMQPKTIEELKAACESKNKVEDCLPDIGCKWEAGKCLFTCNAFRKSKSACEKFGTCAWQEEGPSASKITSCTFRK